MNDFLTPWPEDPVNPVKTVKGTTEYWNGIPRIFYSYNKVMCKRESNKYRGQRYTNMYFYHWLIHRYDLLTRISNQRDKERKLLALLENNQSKTQEGSCPI